jgi:hypothetical protein
VAIGIVVIIFIFPETANHSTLVLASTLTEKFKNLVDLQDKIVGASPDELIRGNPLPSSFQAGVIGIFARIQECKWPTVYIP